MEIFLHKLQNKKLIASLEDKLLLKEAKAGGFWLKLMYRVLDQSSSVALLFRSIWNSDVPTKVIYIYILCFLHRNPLG